MGEFHVTPVSLQSCKSCRRSKVELAGPDGTLDRAVVWTVGLGAEGTGAAGRVMDRSGAAGVADERGTVRYGLISGWQAEIISVCRWQTVGR